MPHTRTETLYYFKELSPEAKQKALNWARARAYEDPDLIDTDFLYDDWQTIAGIFGVEFDSRNVRTMGGKTLSKPKIWWSGFSSQGDGACFEGRWRPAENASTKIREHAPQDETLHAIADNLTAIAEEFKGKHPTASLYATVTHRDRYYHSRSVDFEIGDDNGDVEVDRETEDRINDELRRFMDWMYAQLQAEYDYRTSDECLIEQLNDGDEEFYENGNPAD